jgi:coenzyme F420 biosynthesis associated uncharacterized protein
MAGYGAAFGRGVIIGAGAAFLYAAARETASFARHARRESQSGGEYAERTRLIDWAWAERVAIRASGQAPTLHPSAREQLRAQYSALLRDIEEPVARYTGKKLSLSGTAVEIMDRATWIRANMVNFRDLLQPMEELYREAAEVGGLGLGSSPVGMPMAARLMVSSQLGLLVGYLAQRVLGQYDLSLLGREPITGGKLYFVEPNIRQVEQSLRLPREELRRWIALHEATHAHEFEFHPWVREYLNTALRTYLRLLADDMKRQSGGNVFAAMAARFAGNIWRGHNFIAALQTPEQRELLSRLQALMSLAEGYSNHVMNAVGRSLLPNFELIHERVEHRQRQRSQAEVLFLKLTGLSMKMEQYKRGERFVDHVVRERGIAFANRAWESRENLPSELEIRYPERWIARLEGMRA